MAPIHIPPIAWRPTPRTVHDLDLAGRCAAAGWLLSMVEPTVGMGVLAGTAAWTAGRFHRSHTLTQASRAGWKLNAYGFLTGHVRRIPHPGGDGWDPVDRFVLVHPENWLPAGPALPPNPQHGWRPTYREWRLYRHRQRMEGLRVVPCRVYLIIPPWQVLNYRAFRAHWNELQGYPGTPERPVDPWRWKREPLRMIGEPFSLPPVIPFPEGWWSLDAFRFGILEDGTELVWEPAIQPHVLVGAGTGYGKSGLIRSLAFQAIMGALWANLQPGVGILDPKGDQFTMFEGLAWNERTCEGVKVAWDDLDPNGELATLTNMERTARAFRFELGRRRRTSRLAQQSRLAGQRLPDPIWRPLFLFVDELAELLEREQVAKGDDSAPAQAARRRNDQRASIERSLRVILRLGRDLRIHVVALAQSPRAEFLPMDAKANLGFLLYLGLGSPVELGIIFGKDLPASPPARPGMGVWRDSRENVNPADPYLFLKLYWLDPELIWERLDPLRTQAPTPVAA